MGGFLKCANKYKALKDKIILPPTNINNGMLQINDKNGNDMLILKAFAIAYCKTNNIPTLHSTPKAKENRHNRNNSKNGL